MFHKQLTPRLDWRMGVAIGVMTLLVLNGADAVGYETVEIWAALLGAAAAISLTVLRRARFQE